jgi:uncharacterized LabA/DUF88 family protein
MKTIGIFVDVSNIYYCVGKAYPGRKVDYQKYLDKAASDNVVFRAIAFGVQNNPDSAKFVSCLKHLSYDPRFKQFDQKNPRINSNVAICTEVFKIIEKLDIIVLGSSDPNLADLITWAKDRGVEVHVLACGISHYLKDVANRFIEIDESLLEESKPDVEEAAQ